MTSFLKNPYSYRGTNIYLQILDPLILWRKVSDWKNIGRLYSFVFPKRTTRPNREITLSTSCIIVLHMYQFALQLIGATRFLANGNLILDSPKWQTGNMTLTLHKISVYVCPVCFCWLPGSPCFFFGVCVCVCVTFWAKATFFSLDRHWLISNFRAQVVLGDLCFSHWFSWSNTFGCACGYNQLGCIALHA